MINAISCLSSSEAKVVLQPHLRMETQKQGAFSKQFLLSVFPSSQPAEPQVWNMVCNQVAVKESVKTLSGRKYLIFIYLVQITL